MQMKERLRALRVQHGLTQDGLARQVHVTRQAVSRWETGETEPNTESLKLLSHLYGVSVNTLLGSPRTLICQCCGMPLQEDGLISRMPDGSLQEEYCRWCYQDGQFTYQSLTQLMETVIPHMVQEYAMEEKQARRLLEDTLPQLAHWRERETKDE